MSNGVSASGFPFVGNVLFSLDPVSGDGAHRIGNLEPSPFASCRVFASGTGVDTVDFTPPADQGNLMKDGWSLYADFCAPIAGPFQASAGFFAFAFRWRSGSAASGSFDASALPGFAADALAFHFLRFDAAGKLRSESAAWTVGAYQ